MKEQIEEGAVGKRARTEGDEGILLEPRLGKELNPLAAPFFDLLAIVVALRKLCSQCSRSLLEGEQAVRVSDWKRSSRQNVAFTLNGAGTTSPFSLKLFTRLSREENRER